jgi:hypothetical protein
LEAGVVVLSSDMLICRSFSVVIIFMSGGWMIGTSDM